MNLPADGEYQIVVRSLSSESGEYTLSSDVSSAETTEVQEENKDTDFAEPEVTYTIGEVVTGSLTAGDRELWIFSAEAGQVINITVSPSSELDLSFELTQVGRSFPLTGEIDNSFGE